MGQDHLIQYAVVAIYPGSHTQTLMDGFGVGGMLPNSKQAEKAYAQAEKFAVRESKKFPQYYEEYKPKGKSI